MNLPYWLKGGFLGIAYASVIIFLKGTCPPEWCFADIFMPFIVKPLTAISLFLPKNQIWLEEHLMLAVLAFWFVAGVFFGIIYGAFKKSKI